MTQTFVALDLETTGLDPERDAIIEIGAVKFKGGRVEAEFGQLVNPGRKLTPFITQLTGINDAMLANQPRLPMVLPKLEAFVGDAVIIGHNVGFDLSFLRAKGAVRSNAAADTYALAAVLLPSVGRYNLSALGRALGITIPGNQAHRALDDCRVTARVYLALLEKARALPLPVLADIVNLGRNLDWGGNLMFEEALRARSKERVPARQVGALPEALMGPLFARHDARDHPPLQRKAEIKPLEIDELAALLEHSGPFSKHFPNYEFRAEQVQMLRAVARAFSEGRHLVVEAGTGTGKSVGYLIPAAVWAMQNNERVVISTNTLNLQDQLMRKDIPDLQAALGLDFRAALLKGRSHYLCPRRLDSLRRHGPKTADELRVLAKVLVWLNEAGADVDSAGAPLADLSLGPHERAIWLRISAEDEGCTSDMCQGTMQGRCPFYRARRAAQAAHVVVVNHALLLADIAAESRVLPEYHYLVVDEAHHLEAATTDGLSFEVNRPDLERRLRDLGGPNAGTLGALTGGVRGALPPDQFARFERDVLRAGDDATAGLALTRNFFEAVAQFMEEQRDAQALGEYTQQVRIIPATRTQGYWDQVLLHWEELARVLAPLAATLTQLAGGLAELEEYDIEDREDLMSAATAAARYLAGVVTNLHGLVGKPDPTLIYWAEARRESDRVSLHAAPLHVGPLVQKHLWHAKEAVVLTSATLTTAGEFNYIKGRLAADEADEVSVGSPFDYETSTLLYLPNDIAEPHVRPDYQQAVEKTLRELCTATRGRALALFTSYAQLKQTAQAIREPLARAGIEVYAQSDGTPRNTLLENFKSAAGGVLLGTKSFWEGVDVPGEALSALVIVKLPFDVPTDPIIAARAETFERAFNDYNLPEAVLKFRQGFGRLIRSRSDRGVVVILDRRVLTKQYGRMFLDSLPTCTVRQAPLAQLPREAARWIDGG
ncbi:MAG: DEAD/DEAH box helicase family protein [Anaerolineales bacterium]|nr:DEAD/DEAH box helicase family protein [Anaerolineales bacterium]